MADNDLIQVTAQWIVRNWKDDIVFPSYLKNVPRESKKELISHYIIWALKSGDIKKAHKASKLFGIPLSEGSIESAKRYILEKGKWGVGKWEPSAVGYRLYRGVW